VSPSYRTAPYVGMRVTFWGPTGKFDESVTLKRELTTTQWTGQPGMTMRQALHRLADQIADQYVSLKRGERCQLPACTSDLARPYPTGYWCDAHVPHDPLNPAATRPTDDRRPLEVTDVQLPD
jgi:hypothetical protein